MTMSNCVILQKVVYRLPGTKRPVFALVLGHGSDGLSLLLLKPNGQGHSLAIAVQGEQGDFESVNVSQFPVELADMTAIGTKLQAIAGSLGEDEVEQFLKDLL